MGFNSGFKGLKCSVRVLMLFGDFYEVSKLPIEIFSY
jgi:hypothetical protein